MIINAFVSESLLTRRNAAGCSASAPRTEHSTKRRRGTTVLARSIKFSQEITRANI